MSLKSNFEYIRDWINSNFLKRDGLSLYQLKSDYEDDELVISASLNDLNSRILNLNLDLNSNVNQLQSNLDKISKEIIKIINLNSYSKSVDDISDNSDLTTNDIIVPLSLLKEIVSNKWDYITFGDIIYKVTASSNNSDNFNLSIKAGNEFTIMSTVSNGKLVTQSIELNNYSCVSPVCLMENYQGYQYLAIKQTKYPSVFSETLAKQCVKNYNGSIEVALLKNNYWVNDIWVPYKGNIETLSDYYKSVITGNEYVISDVSNFSNYDFKIETRLINE